MRKECKFHNIFLLPYYKIRPHIHQNKKPYLRNKEITVICLKLPEKGNSHAKMSV